MVCSSFVSPAPQTAVENTLSRLCGNFLVLTRSMRSGPLDESLLKCCRMPLIVAILKLERLSTIRLFSLAAHSQSAFLCGGGSKAQTNRNKESRVFLRVLSIAGLQWRECHSSASNGTCSVLIIWLHMQPHTEVITSAYESATYCRVGAALGDALHKHQTYN